MHLFERYRSATRKRVIASLMCVNVGGAHMVRSRRQLSGIGRRQDWRSIMKAKDVMTRKVISVAPDASILEALRLMLQNKISGLPVVARGRQLVGIVTKAAFLPRPQTATTPNRPP